MAKLKQRQLKRSMCLYKGCGILKTKPVSRIYARYKKLKILNWVLAKALTKKEKENQSLISLLNDYMNVVHVVCDNANNMISATNLIRGLIENCKNLKTRLSAQDSGKKQLSPRASTNKPATAIVKAAVNRTDPTGVKIMANPPIQTSSSPNRSIFPGTVANPKAMNTNGTINKNEQPQPRHKMKRHPWKNCTLNNHLWRDWSLPSFMRDSKGKSSVSSCNDNRPRLLSEKQQRGAGKSMVNLNAKVQPSTRNGVDPAASAQTDSNMEDHHLPSPDRCRFVNQRRGLPTHQSLRYDCDDDDVDENDTLLLKIKRSPPFRRVESEPPENGVVIDELLKEPPLKDLVARQTLSSEESPLFVVKKSKRMRLRFTDSSDETIVHENQFENKGQMLDSNGDDDTINEDLCQVLTHVKRQHTAFNLGDILNSPNSKALNEELEKLAAATLQKCDGKGSETDVTITGPFSRSQLAMPTSISNISTVKIPRMETEKSGGKDQHTTFSSIPTVKMHLNMHFSQNENS